MLMLRPVPKNPYKKRKPTRRKRNNFSNKIRQEIYEECGGKCQQCGGKGQEVHHVMPRSRSGRGVKTNGLLVCQDCHRKIHQDNDLLNDWKRHYKSFYGENFYKDFWDLE